MYMSMAIYGHIWPRMAIYIHRALRTKLFQTVFTLRSNSTFSLVSSAMVYYLWVSAEELQRAQRRVAFSWAWMATILADKWSKTRFAVAKQLIKDSRRAS